MTSDAEVLQDWELLLSEISRNGTALDNDALDAVNQTMRAALSPPSASNAEALEADIRTVYTYLGCETNKRGLDDSFAAMKRIETALQSHVDPDVEPIDGLDEAIAYSEGTYFVTGDDEEGFNQKRAKVFEAARRYAALPKSAHGVAVDELLRRLRLKMLSSKEMVDAAGKSQGAGIAVGYNRGVLHAIAEIEDALKTENAKG